MLEECGVCSLIPRGGGVYILVVRVPLDVKVAIGRTEITVSKGFYVYCGSAWGPGGLHARVCRHLGCRPRRSLHWHIDRLLARGGEVCGFAVIPSLDRSVESFLAAILAASRLTEPLGAVFGGTDDPGRMPHLARCKGSWLKCLEALPACVGGEAILCWTYEDKHWDCVTSKPFKNPGRSR